MARMTGFVFQDDYLEKTARLTDEEFGRLVRALATYHVTGEVHELEGRECGYFDFIKGDIDRIDDKYEARCQTNRNNRQRNDANDDEQQRTITNDNERQQSSTNEHKDKDKDKDKVKDKDIKSANALSANAQEVARRFDKFWSVYPRHEGKQAAQKAFDKIKPDDTLLETMINTIVRQKQTEQWSDPRFIPHPATWLNGRRWEDEPVKPGGGKRVLAQQYEQREYKEQEMAQILGVHSLFEEDSA